MVSDDTTNTGTIEHAGTVTQGTVALGGMLGGAAASTDQRLAILEAGQPAVASLQSRLAELEGIVAKYGPIIETVANDAAPSTDVHSRLTEVEAALAKAGPVLDELATVAAAAADKGTSIGGILGVVAQKLMGKFLTPAI